MIAVSGLVAGPQVAIALVPPGIEAAIGDGVFHGALGLVSMRAVGIAAVTDVGADIAVVAGDFFGHDVPKLKLSNARRIDDEAAHRQRNQAGDGGRVLALLILATDLGDA